jgi:hypothetical protein
MNLLGFITIIHHNARSFEFYIIYEFCYFASKYESLRKVTILEVSQIDNHISESLLRFKH